MRIPVPCRKCEASRTVADAYTSAHTQTHVRLCDRVRTTVQHSQNTDARVHVHIRTSCSRVDSHSNTLSLVGLSVFVCVWELAACQRSLAKLTLCTHTRIYTRAHTRAKVVVTTRASSLRPQLRGSDSTTRVWATVMQTRDNESSHSVQKFPRKSVGFPYPCISGLICSSSISPRSLFRLAGQCGLWINQGRWLWYT